MSDGVRGYIRADEKLLWTGKPQQGLRFSVRDLFAVPFSLLWGGMALGILFAGGGEITGAGFPLCCSR